MSPSNTSTQRSSSTRKSISAVPADGRSSRRHTSMRKSVKKEKSTARSSSKRNSKSRQVSSKRHGGETNILRSVWSVMMPYVVTAWTLSSILWSLIFTWIYQRVIRMYWNATGQKVTAIAAANKFGTALHTITSFLVVEMNPFWERNVIRDIPMEDLPKKAIYMSNHLSYSDSFLGMGLLPTAPKVVLQGPMFQVPIVGHVLTENGDIPVGIEKRANGTWGTTPGAGALVVSRAKEYLDNNCSIAIMPEGRISLTGDMFDFKMGFFNIAVELDVPIVPFAMWGNQAAWPMDVDEGEPEFFMRSASTWLHMGAPIYPEGRTPEELKDAVTLRITELRNNLPNYHGNAEHYGEVAKKN